MLEISTAEVSLVWWEEEANVWEETFELVGENLFMSW
jgi:hypothetical protein